MVAQSVSLWEPYQINNQRYKPKGNHFTLSAQLNFYLLQLSNQPEDQSPTIKVKLSGDGARMSHSINLFVCSFSILDEGQNVLSSAGTYMHLFINSRASFLKIEIPNR